ncbi:MAG: hypothetical protein HYS12_28340, partial [Planctomycetes bacterium]|nr:hypothetical protein [Planctomycetota bacterium]
MFRSKPIGWITAGTLFCVAGVALACRLRDGKETTAEANAAACPSAAEAKDESSAPAKTTAEPKEPEKKEKESPFPAPPPSLDKPPAVGEVVAPAATTPDKEAKSEREKTATAIPPSPPPDLSSLPAPPAPPTAADTAPVPEVRKEKDVGTAPAAPPRANLLSPEMTAEATPIRPISGNEGAVPAPPADPKTAPAWSAVPASEKKAATKPETKSPELLTGTAPPPSPSSGPVPPATIPMKEEAVGPPPVDPNRPSFPPPSAGTVIPSGTAPSETTQRTRPTLVFRHHVIPSGTAPTETTQPPLAPPASSMPKPLPMTDTPSMPPTSPATPLYKVRGKGETLRA